MRSLSRLLGAAALTIGMSLSGLASAGDTSTAEHLFQQGLDAMKRNQFKEACDAFAGSNEADPSPGTQINLALCNEKQSKLATAWGWYRTAAGTADQRGQKERAELARGEAAKLEPKLHKLVISMKAPADGLVVTRDGTTIPNAVLGTDVPIDPGAHVIEVRAKGKRPWNQTVQIAVTPGTDRIEVPALEDEPGATSSPGGGTAEKPASGPDGSTQRTVGFILGGAGILALVTAGGIQIFNLAVVNSDVKDLDADLKTMCGVPPTASPQICEGLRTSRDSKDDARESNQLGAIVVGAAGAAMLIGGIVLLVTAPSSKSAKNTRPLLVPFVGRGSAGLGFQARF